MDERRKGMMLILCYVFINVNHGDLMHVCMSCASGYFLLCYFSTDTYLRYLCSSWYHAGLSFLWRSATCIVLYLSKTSLWGTYMSPPCESMCTCMDRVWGSTTHPTLPETEKSPGHITILKERSQSCYLCNCITNLNNWMTYWEFLKILKSRVTLIFFM